MFVANNEVLTAVETLDELCRINPPKPVAFGIAKAVGGSTALAAAVGIGISMSLGAKDFVEDAPTLGGHWYFAAGIFSFIGAVVSLPLAKIGTTTLGAGLAALVDRLLPEPAQHKDGVMYRVNGGYTKNLSVIQRPFATRIKAIDSLQDLKALSLGEHFLVNDLEVNPATSGADVVNVSGLYTSTQHNVLIEAVLNGKRFDAAIVSSAEDFPIAVIAKNRVNPVYLIAKYTGVDQYEIAHLEVKHHGPAFLRG